MIHTDETEIKKKIYIYIEEQRYNSLRKGNQDKNISLISYVKEE